MKLLRNPGRIAGLWYLLLVLLGPLSLVYIPKKIYALDDPSATVHNLIAHELLFRVGILSELVEALVLIYMVMAFYRLFSGVDARLAMQVAIFGGVMPAVLSFVYVVTDAGALGLAKNNGWLGAFTEPQRDSVVVFLLRLGGLGNTAEEMLWGLWLLPLALLVYRSSFLPRVLGVWLGINGVTYIALCVLGELAPQYSGKAFLFAQPALFGELALMLWLVIKGSKPTMTAASKASGFA